MRNLFILGLLLRIGLDASYSNLYEHVLYIGPDKKKALHHSVVRGRQTKKDGKKRPENFTSLLLGLDIYN